MSTRLPLLMVLAAVSCGGQPQGPLPPTPPPGTLGAALPKPPPPSPPSGLRLPRTATPVRYQATLTVVPTEAVLSGAIDIDLSLAEPSSVLWLNGTAITVER